MSDIRVSVLRKRIKHNRRKKRVSKKLYGVPERPRMVVVRSNRHIYAQIIDDLNRKTIVGCSTMTPSLKEKLSSVNSKIDQAKIVGEHMAQIAKEKGVEQIMFDRNGRKYHGRVKAFAEGARTGGLKF